MTYQIQTECRIRSSSIETDFVYAHPNWIHFAELIILINVCENWILHLNVIWNIPWHLNPCWLIRSLVRNDYYQNLLSYQIIIFRSQRSTDFTKQCMHDEYVQMFKWNIVTKVLCLYTEMYTIFRSNWKVLSFFSSLFYIPSKKHIDKCGSIYIIMYSKENHVQMTISVSPCTMQLWHT